MCSYSGSESMRVTGQGINVSFFVSFFKKSPEPRGSAAGQAALIRGYSGNPAAGPTRNQTEPLFASGNGNHRRSG